MPAVACTAETSCRQCAIKSSAYTFLLPCIEMIDNDGAAAEHALKQRAHKRRCYSREAFVPHAIRLPCLCLTERREMEQKGWRMQVGVGLVEGRLAGHAAPAKQRIRYDGKVSTFSAHARTVVSDKSEIGASSRR